MPARKGKPAASIDAHAGSATGKPWASAADGVRLRVRLTPKSSRDEVCGVEETAEGVALKVRVRAVPEDGKANAAAVEVVAKWLQVPKTTVALVAGGKSRIKSLAVGGRPAELESRLGERLAALPET